MLGVDEYISQTNIEPVYYYYIDVPRHIWKHTEDTQEEQKKKLKCLDLSPCKDRDHYTYPLGITFSITPVCVTPSSV